MPELSINYGLALKVETTAGTWAAPTMAADALRLAGEPSVSIRYVLPGDRDGVAVAGYGVPPGATPLGRVARITFSTELVGSGTAGTPPRWGRILQTFMTETIVGTPTPTNIDYEPSAAQRKTLSVLLEHANKKIEVRGAIPESLQLAGPTDEARVLVNCTLVGIVNSDPVELALEAQTFGDQAATPSPFTGAFTVGGTAMKYEQFELDFGLSVRPWRLDRNLSDVLAPGLVTQVNPRVRFPGEVEALAAHDPFTRQKTPTTALAYSQRLGTTAGNRYLVTGSHVEYQPGEELGFRTENGIVYYDLSLRFVRPASGTWFKISHD